MRLFSGKNRPVHMGPYPYERLTRAGSEPARPAYDARQPHHDADPADASAGSVLAPYFDLYRENRDGPVAPTPAPLPDDPARRADNLKAGCFFLDANGAAICELPPEANTWGVPADHTHALLILVHHGKSPLPDEACFDWISGAEDAFADLRAAEIACCLAGYIRNLGFAAQAYFSYADCDMIPLAGLAVKAGLLAEKDGEPCHPFSERGFRIAAVTTSYSVLVDTPLAGMSGLDRRRAQTALWFMAGQGLASPLEDRPGRALHLGRYPMDSVKRVDRPTTLVDESKIQRVAKRAEFFQRALMGDLGDKAKRERERFATKNPYALAMTPFIRGMVPFQHGPAAVPAVAAKDDAQRNAEAVKGLAYHLGADMVGICEAKTYAWYTHDAAGSPVPVRHKYAIVMLIDQGFDTMEGSSGDDWISGAQSMRSYMRGAQIAGVLAAQLRKLGHDSRSQTNADSEVLHIPLILWAGLGELSRIGELVLNPYVGPRFKSVVVTTDMPLQTDRPVDFGLIDFCNKCNKCARECPSSAIPLGPRIEYNGYEIWKPDVERCTRYRVTNPKGSACGRCMKTCPFNTEGLLSNRAVLWAAMHVPASRGMIARWDDRAGNGSINPEKKWWFDLEQVDGVAIEPQAGTNRRGLNFDANTDPAKQRVALYPPEEHPLGDDPTPQPVDRKRALEAGAKAKTIP